MWDFAVGQSLQEKYNIPWFTLFWRVYTYKGFLIEAFPEIDCLMCQIMVVFKQGSVQEMLSHLKRGLWKAKNRQ